VNALREQVSELRSYRIPWKGQLLLVCRKCERKLRKSGSFSEGATLKKALKVYAKLDPQRGPKLHVLGVDCLKLCPKGGLAVCTGTQMRRIPAEVSLLRSAGDIAELYRILRDLEPR